MSKIYDLICIDCNNPFQAKSHVAPRCVECKKLREVVRKAAWEAANKECIAARKAAQRKANPGQNAAKCAAWREVNKERAAISQAAWREAK